ncbi:hypothetical protein ACFQI7_00060 [Paenibacillus allorhizosphaerae]|uniref:DNA mismatch repair protein n=1 Tax=Paenibacillus allorhizosphaerae TaxID=2849866 RepID=A0ABM8VSQ9_9BACL|nr:hypothetical protein [Paenibacillus allorhizosphaerae]CAG7656867.1 hypothetical protein PAECIP111802_06545 [Paenibacillus allorhizosphaerae]
MFDDYMLNEKDIYYITRKELIEYGIQFLDGVGSNSICKVCIKNGGSCCNFCSHLKNGAGCQSRNTSCTSWLCGYLKLLFYSAGLLKGWNALWDEVPGIDFRKDYTPPLIKMRVHLEVPRLKELGEALAVDLKSKLSRDEDNLDFIVLKEDLDDLIDQIQFAENSTVASFYKRRLDHMLKDFTEFRQSLIRMKLHH